MSKNKSPPLFTQLLNFSHPEIRVQPVHVFQLKVGALPFSQGRSWSLSIDIFFLFLHRHQPTVSPLMKIWKVKGLNSTRFLFFLQLLLSSISLFLVAVDLFVVFTTAALCNWNCVLQFTFYTCVVAFAGVCCIFCVLNLNFVRTKIALEKKNGNETANWNLSR